MTPRHWKWQLSFLALLFVSSALGICLVHASLRLPRDSEDPGALSPWPDTPYLRGASPAHRATCTGSGVASRVTANTCGLVQAQSLCVFSAQVSVPEELMSVCFKYPLKLWGKFSFMPSWFVLFECGRWREAWPRSEGRCLPPFCRGLASRVPLGRPFNLSGSQLHHFKWTQWIRWLLFSFDTFFCFCH